MPAITTTRYALTTADRQGRLADRSVVKAMEWVAGQPITVAAAPDGIVVCTTKAGGQETLATSGFLYLPARIRRQCQIGTGDRLLVAGYPEHDVVLVFTLAVLDAVTRQRIKKLV